MAERDYHRARAPMALESGNGGPTRSNALARLRRILSGQDCLLCGQDSRASLCPGCAGDLPRLPGARCPSCALPSPAGQVCGRCVAEPPAFDATFATLAYGFPATRLIQDFKYAGAVGLARLLGGLLAEAVGPDPGRADLVVPMPLAPTRLVERGYNQALEIARALPVARHVIDARAVERVRHGPPQAELPWRERWRNVRGAFRAGRRFDGMSIAVVDDVMTTGASLNELAQTLKSAGAARVENWVLARTLAPASGSKGDDLESRAATQVGLGASD